MRYLALIPIFIASCTPSKIEEPPYEELARLAKNYQIEIVTLNPTFPVKNSHGMIDGHVAEDKELRAYAGLFASEFSLYPVEAVKRAQLKRIVLCRELSFAGQLRTAIPDYDHDTLYLDVVRGSYDKRYVRKVLHHEFFHLIDYRDDGNVYQDERWAKLNAKDFKYGNGGKNAQDRSDTSLLTDKYPGFLNHYSTTGVEEDKAELFAHLIIESKHVEEYRKNDKVIKAKVERLKELLSEFCPEMNDDFWEKAQSLKRDGK
jgi:hypothetical protein